MSERVMTPTARPCSVTSTAVERPLESSSNASSTASCCSTVGRGASITSTTCASSTSGLWNRRSSSDPSWTEPTTLDMSDGSSPDTTGSWLTDQVWSRSMASLTCWWEATRSEEHTSELQSLAYLVCRLLL